MDEALSQRIEALKEEIIHATEEVTAADESREKARELAAVKAVDAIVEKFNDLIDELEGDDRGRAERILGRPVTDLRRQAAQLTQGASGVKAELARDAGSVPFLLQRAPGKSIVPQRAAPGRDAPKFSVGSEVDAWCGKCKEVRTHNVIAMVGGQPKQVVCQTCNSRHNYRAEPPTRAQTGERPVVTGTTGTARRAVDPETQRRQDQKRALQKELADAVEPRTFDPKARYKAGEIIVHPEHGRGKIENVLKGSLLVRFLEGLRPLDLT